jgi:hypothetical protein
MLTPWHPPPFQAQVVACPASSRTDARDQRSGAGDTRSPRISRYQTYAWYAAPSTRLRVAEVKSSRGARASARAAERRRRIRSARPQRDPRRGGHALGPRPNVLLRESEGGRRMPVRREDEGASAGGCGGTAANRSRELRPLSDTLFLAPLLALFTGVGRAIGRRPDALRDLRASPEAGL